MFQNICGILSGSLVDFSEFVWTVIPLMMFHGFSSSILGDSFRIAAGFFRIAGGFFGIFSDCNPRDDVSGVLWDSYGFSSSICGIFQDRCRIFQDSRGIVLLISVGIVVGCAHILTC